MLSNISNGTYLVSHLVEDVGHIPEVGSGEDRVEEFPLPLVLVALRSQDTGSKKQLEVTSKLDQYLHATLRFATIFTAHVVRSKLFGQFS